MKQGISAALIAVFLATALMLLGAFNWSKPRILVMHSLTLEELSVKKMDDGNRIRASELGARNVNLPSIYIEAARMDQLYFP